MLQNVLTTLQQLESRTIIQFNHNPNKIKNKHTIKLSPLAITKKTNLINLFNHKYLDLHGTEILLKKNTNETTR